MHTTGDEREVAEALARATMAAFEGALIHEEGKRVIVQTGGGVFELTLRRICAAVERGLDASSKTWQQALTQATTRAEDKLGFVLLAVGLLIPGG